MTEHTCGRIGFVTIIEASDRAATMICGAKEKLAVCIDSEGRVTVESIEHAIIEEMVDVYAPTDGWNVLQRAIESDLVAAMKERGISGGRAQRVRVPNSGRRAA